MRPLPLLALLAACTAGDHETGDTAVDDLNPTRTAETASGWVLVYTPDPDPIPQSEEFELTVIVEAPGGGEALPGALRVDAEMPAHGHGMNTEPVTTDHGDGSYTVRGMLFHMPGHWRIDATLTDDGDNERTWWDVDCCS